jgi:predicted RND superfamily exporter protein
MRKLYKYPWLIIAVIAVITVFFALQLPRAELDNNNLRFVPLDNPSLKTSQWIDSMFGSSFFILVGLERQYDTVFDGVFLDRIREYTRAIEDYPIVRTVTSIISADYINLIDDTIVVEKLVGNDFTGTREEIAELKNRLLSWDMYERALYSDDFSATQILIPLTIDIDQASTREVTEQFLAIRDIAREMFSDLAAVHVTGMPIISATVNEAMNADLLLLVPVVMLITIVILLFSFRRVTPVLLPLLTVVITIIWAIGAMPLFGVKLSVISTVLPVILVAVGIGESIHILIHYQKAVQGQNKVIDHAEHAELVIAVIMKMRRAVFLTATTTLGGFIAFCFTKVAPCKEFGYFASFGVAVAFIITMTLVPALLIINGPKSAARQSAVQAKEEDSKFNAFVADNLLILAQRKKTILFFAVLVIGFSIYGITKLIIDNVMIEYFRHDTDIYRSDEFIRRQFGGSKVISVVVQSDSYETTLHPDTLSAMDRLSIYLQEKIPNVGKVMGFTDLVKRINQVFNADASPDGLPPSSSTGAGGDSFGFGDFGFGNFDAPVPVTPAAVITNENYTADRNKIYTQNELFGIIDRAGNQSRAMSADELVWELKRQVNYEGASYYEIPVDPKRYGKKTPQELQQIVSNYLLLLSGNISDYANDPLEPTAIKATVQLRTMGMIDSHAVFNEIKEYVTENFPENVEVTLGGTTMVESSLNDLVVQSQVISMMISVISIFIIISIANKSLIAGLMAMTPLSISILLNFAIMGLAGIKLNLGTSMVGAVSVCVGIDYTIHSLEAYKREYLASRKNGENDDINFLRRVFFSSGKAIIINATSVGAGFAVMLLSSFVMLADFGLLVAFTMFSSSLVSLTVLPAMLALIKPKFIYNC